MDVQTTIEDLRQKAEKFVIDRNWGIHHTPRNLAQSICIEAAELLEIFQWDTNEDPMAIADDEERFNHLKEEVSDVICYCLNLANTLNFDISDEVTKKIAKNEKKYPLSKNTDPMKIVKVEE